MRTTMFTILLVLGLGPGCGSPEVEDGAGDEATTGSEEEDSSLAAQRLVDIVPRGGATGESCAVETVYFAFDSNELTSRSRDAIESAVGCLRANQANARLHVTGATDPEGTEEYNLALGERRANAVRTFLTGLGVDAERVSVSSVGEEMASGQDEEGWAQDRNAATRVTN